MRRVTQWSVVLFAVSVLSLCFFVGLLSAKPWRPITREAFGERRIYAYRGWQSTDYTVQPGDLLTIRADGEWMYSPEAGFHGPAGHPVYRAPAFYPLPAVGGGALVGRIGESGVSFYVGKYHNHAGFMREDRQETGPLYLRIDDDLLGDNKGYVTVWIEITEPQ